MKHLILTVRICCLAFVSLLFAFEVSPAQQPVIDFGIESCSVEKMPGTDSVLVIIDIEYAVADSSMEPLDLHYGILHDLELVRTGYIEIPRVSRNNCVGGWGYCFQRYCPPLEEWEALGFCTEFGDDCCCMYVHAISWRMGEPSGTEVTVILDDISAIPELDETNNECSTTYVPPEIPTLTEWGLIIFGVVLLGFITWVFLKRRKVVGVRI